MYKPNKNDEYKFSCECVSSGLTLDLPMTATNMNAKYLQLNMFTKYTLFMYAKVYEV